MRPSVSITEDGRSGHVVYNQGLRSITGYWEFGGHDVVTIVSMGTRAEWDRAHGWAVAVSYTHLTLPTNREV